MKRAFLGDRVNNEPLKFSQMYKSYLITALRSLSRNRGFAFINVFCLSIGITACLLIFLFVQDELSYDRYAQKGEQIYRVGLRERQNGKLSEYPMVGAAVGKGIQNEYPGVAATTRLSTDVAMVSYDNQTFKESSFALVDANFFEIFSIPFLKGDPKTALAGPNSIVITDATARKYFGDADPIGKTMTLKNRKVTCRVTGVIAKLPRQSHFHFDFFESMLDLESSKEADWGSSSFYTYLLLRDTYDYKNLEAKLPQVVEKYIYPGLLSYFGLSMGEYKKNGGEFAFFLQPLQKIHLHSNLKYELESNGDIRYVYIFSAIAVFILLIACINFINLSTANSAKRSKEVGLRKALGSGKSQLITQFLAESIVIAFAALFLSLILVAVLLPFLNAVSGKELSMAYFLDAKVLLGLLLLGGGVGLVAGSYPAFFLSSFRPVMVLKAMAGGGRGTAGLRNSLVVFQFMMSTLLIICTVVVYQQRGYMLNKQVGYDKEQVLVISDTYVLGDKNEEVFKEKLLQLPSVRNVTISGFVPVGETFIHNASVAAEGADNGGAEANVDMAHYSVDYDYIPTLGLKIKTGRNFSREFSTDSSAVILNETAAKEFGFGDNPIGRRINMYKKKLTVIGVVKDFHFESLQQKIRPLMIHYENTGGKVIVKATTDDIPGLIAKIKAEWDGFSPSAPFSYSFLDERFAAAYNAEQKTGRIFTIFSGVAICIACLGLFALAAFATEQRTKEVALRKVLGADTVEVVTLLSKNFLRLVLLANVIAFPLAWYAMHKWLENFAYRVDVHWWVFVMTSFAVLVIALITVSFQTIKAALATPVQSLRNM
jgi:putative ABC transport system permease protein